MRDDRRRELTPREIHRQRRKEQIARRRLVAILCLLGLIILIIVLVATCGSKDGTTTTTVPASTTSTTLGASTFTADLTGEDTDGTGTFTLTYDPDNEALSYELMLDGVKAPTDASIFETGTDGDTVVYSLYADTTETGDYTGRLAEGTIDEASLKGSLEGGTIGDLIQLIRDGKAYVKVGTDTPTDAIRGDLTETTSTESTDETSSTDETTESTDETSTSETTETTE